GTDDDRGSEEASADPLVPQLVAGRRPEGAEPPVEAAGEDLSVRDRGRRVAEPSHTGRPHDTAVGGVHCDDLPRARDRIQPGAVTRGTRVEALVAERIALEIRRPTLGPRTAVEADEGAGVIRDAHGLADDRGTRVDAAARLVGPYDATRVGLHG